MPSARPYSGKCSDAAGIRVMPGASCKVMSIPFDQTDFSVVVKNRAPPPKPWRWEIYRAGRKSPIECSSILYETVEAANRAGKQALKQLLTEFPD
jgi:hypothetical protein